MKQCSNFIRTKSKSLRLGRNWDVVEPVGKKGGLSVAWSDRVQIRQKYKNDLCFELLIEQEKVELTFWEIFVYASTDSSLRRAQYTCSKGVVSGKTKGYWEVILMILGIMMRKLG